MDAVSPEHVLRCFIVCFVNQKSNTTALLLPFISVGAQTHLSNHYIVVPAAAVDVLVGGKLIKSEVCRTVSERWRRLSGAQVSNQCQ